MKLRRVNLVLDDMRSWIVALETDSVNIIERAKADFFWVAVLSKITVFDVDWSHHGRYPICFKRLSAMNQICASPFLSKQGPQVHCYDPPKPFLPEHWEYMMFSAFSLIIAAY